MLAVPLVVPRNKRILMFFRSEKATSCGISGEHLVKLSVCIKKISCGFLFVTNFSYIFAVIKLDKFSTAPLRATCEKRKIH